MSIADQGEFRIGLHSFSLAIGFFPQGFAIAKGFNEAIHLTQDLEVSNPVILKCKVRVVLFFL